MSQIISTPHGELELPDEFTPEQVQGAVTKALPQMAQQSQLAQVNTQSLSPMGGNAEMLSPMQAMFTPVSKLLNGSHIPTALINNPIENLISLVGKLKGMGMPTPSVNPTIQGIGEGVKENVIDPMSSPGGALTALLPGVSPLVAKLAGLGFAGQAVVNTPEIAKQMGEASVTGDARERAKVYTGGVANLLQAVGGVEAPRLVEEFDNPAKRAARMLDSGEAQGKTKGEVPPKMRVRYVNENPWQGLIQSLQKDATTLKQPEVKPASTIGGAQADLPIEAQTRSKVNNSRAAWGDFGGLNKPAPQESSRQLLSLTPGSFPHEPVVNAWKNVTKNAPEVEVVNDAGMKVKQGENEYGVQGTVENGKIKVNLAHIESPTELARVLREEHNHLVLDSEEGRKTIQEALGRNLGEQERASLMKRYGELPPDQAMNEFLAQTHSEQKTGFRKVVEDMKLWLGKKGLVNLNDREVAKAMMKTLHEKVNKGGEKGDPISKEEQEEALRGMGGNKSLTKNRLFSTSTEKEFDKEKPFGIHMGKDGMVPVESLRSRMARMVGQGEMQALEESGFGEWLNGKGRRVSGEKVKEWVRENGPKVEVRKATLGEGQKQRAEIVEAERNMNSAMHELESRGFEKVENEGPLFGALRFKENGEQIIKQGDVYYTYDKNDNFLRQTSVAQSDNILFKKYFEGKEQWERIGRSQEPGQDVHWSFVAPKAEKDMPGYTEIAVVKPNKSTSYSPAPFWEGDISKEDQQKGVLYGSSHNFPPNTLAFARGYMETNPQTGKKTWHMIEAQSDWANDYKKENDNKEEEWAYTKHDLTPNDPLLQHYESLALKASIQHAIEQGADYIAVSDAETAMMSEGHDRAASMAGNEFAQHEYFDDEYKMHQEANRLRKEGFTVNEPDEADGENGFCLEWTEPREPDQAKGMRLHYDQSLPDILEKLTGVKGERVNFGEHKEAMDMVNGGQRVGNILQPRKDLIFRNPDSTPKTSVTARSFPLDTLKLRIAKGEPAALYRSSYSLTPDPIGLKTFAEKDVAPAVKKGVDALKASKDLIIGMFSPTSLASTHDLDILFKAKGYKEEFITKIHAAVDSMRAAFDKLPQQEQIEFIDRYKTGTPQTTPALQAAADLFRKWDGQLFQEMAHYTPSVDFKDNHMRVLWKEIPGAQQVKGNDRTTFMGRKPFRGTMGMLRKSTLADMSEGLMKGGVPVSYNPFEMQLLNAQDIMKYVSANRAWEGLKKTGSVVFVRNGVKPPEGYTRIKDTISKVYFPTPKGRVSPGEYWVQKDTARLLNNYLSTDYVREGVTGKIGRPLMDLKNASTWAELALSPFHAFFISGETMGSSLGLGLAKMTTEGQRVKGLKELPSVVTSPLTTFKLGGRVERLAKSASMAEFQKNHPEDYKWFSKNYPSMVDLLQDAFNGGAKIGLNEDFQSSFGKGLQKAITDGNYIGAALRAVPALNDAIVARPLFDKYIPRLKLGMFFREYSFELERRAGDLASGEITRGELARKTWNFIDDRFGEMNYDNLYWDRTFKSALQLMFRSVTWKAGDVRGFGKAGRDFATDVIGKGLKGETPQLSLPTAWLISMAVMTSVLSSVVTKTATGKYPWELAENEKDLVKNLTFPRVSLEDEGQRLSVPTYWKDAVHAVHSPSKFLQSSMTGEINRVSEDWENKDFFNVEVRDPNDPVTKQAWDSLKHLFPEPISVSSFIGAKNQGKPMEQQIAGALGFPAAPGYVTDSPALQLAKQIRGEKAPQKPVTHAQAEKRQQEKKAVVDIKAGKETEQEAMQKGEVDRSRFETVRKKIKDTPLEYYVEGMGVEDAMKVWEKADVKEKEGLRAELKRKVYNSTSITWQRRKELVGILDKKQEEKKPSIFKGFDE